MLRYRIRPVAEACRMNRQRALVALIFGAVLFGASPIAVAVAATTPPVAHALDLPEGDANWRWPVDGKRAVVQPFRAPAHDYAPGHRGMDIAIATPDDEAPVHAPADGVIAFRGIVVDRPLVTIDHGNGLVTTLEPVTSELAPGSKVTAGDLVGTMSAGGHSVRGTLHVGVRLRGVYINPQLLFGGVPRAILLPCGAAGC